MSLSATDPQYIVTTQPRYGDVIGILRGGSDQVIFTDDFNKFLDELIRIVRANYTVIAQLLDVLGYTSDDVGDILDNGLDPIFFQQLADLISFVSGQRSELSNLTRSVRALEAQASIIRSFEDRIRSLEVAVSAR